ncbi:MAG: anthranilate synthase component II, partial [Intestinibacter sp.]
MIVLIDNYDSFTYNLYQYLGEFDQVKIFRNDEVTVDEIRALNPKGVVISPGPGIPEDSNVSLDVIKELGDEIPVLGICLGHQAIGIVFGGDVVRADKIYHGKQSTVTLKDDLIFKGIPKEIDVMRYHSLVVDKNTFSDELEILAETKQDKVIMAVKHKNKNIYGLQFHPESV